jgi:riboflavin synthase
MFNGLIREIASVKSFDGKFLMIDSKYSPNIGDSIAVNGACLTVVKFDKNSFTVEVSDESCSILALENYKNLVHIEPAMALGDRIEGHILQGHIDTIGVIDEIIKNSNSYDFYIKVKSEFSKLLPPKGSVAIDGVSLTINETFSDSFRLTIIPHTIENTLFREYRIGRRVNVETDMFARYLFHMFGKSKDRIKWSDIDKINFSY